MYFTMIFLYGENVNSVLDFSYIKKLYFIFSLEFSNDQRLNNIYGKM